MTTITVDPRLRLATLEDWLTSRHIAWTLDPAIPLGNIDTVAGLANQVRNDPLDHATADRYADDLRAGDIFPAIVLRAIDGRLCPLGGNHRLAAHQGVKPTVAAYIVTCDDLTADLLAYQDNRHHGRPTTRAENIAHALRLHAAGLTIPDAARSAGIDRTTIAQHIGAARGADRARRNNLLDGYRRLAVSVRYHLNRIHDDRVFSRATRHVIDRAIAGASMEKLASKLNDLGVQKAIDYLDELAADNEGRTRNTAGRPPSATSRPAARLRHDLDIVMRYDPAAIAVDCPTPEQREQTRGQIRAAARKLMAIDKALERGR